MPYTTINVTPETRDLFNRIKGPVTADDYIRDLLGIKRRPRRQDLATRLVYEDGSPASGGPEGGGRTRYAEIIDLRDNEVLSRGVYEPPDARLGLAGR